MSISRNEIRRFVKKDRSKDVLIANAQLLDYDATRSKVRKLIDKPSEDPTRLPKVPSNSVCIGEASMFITPLGSTRT
jgi:hypothetical protein